MKVLIVAATLLELDGIEKNLSKFKNLKIHICPTGIGLMQSSVNLVLYRQAYTPDFILQIGIGGCFNSNEKLGSVWAIDKEYVGDSGVMEGNTWKDLFDLKFPEANHIAYTRKALLNKKIKLLKPTTLPTTTAVTVNQISTNELHIKQMIKKYKPTIESMEGAALHYVGNLFNIYYLQLRAASNYIGERDKTKWKMELAIKNLHKETWNYLAWLNKNY